jgi:hypothetical protein
MAYRTSLDGQQRILDHLAESVFQLSDEEILDEVRESGVDPQEEADRTSVVLRQAVDTWESENERLSNLGHTISPNYWRSGQRSYHNNCLNCGASVSFSTTTQRMEGNALDGSCPDNGYTTKKREASR